MASFHVFYSCLHRDALLVPIIDCLTSFFSGFVIFTVLGFMAHDKGADIKDVATDGKYAVQILYYSIYMVLNIISVGETSPSPR